MRLFHVLPSHLSAPSICAITPFRNISNRVQVVTHRCLLRACGRVPSSAPGSRLQGGPVCGRRWCFQAWGGQWSRCSWQCRTAWSHARPASSSTEQTSCWDVTSIPGCWRWTSAPPWPARRPSLPNYAPLCRRTHCESCWIDATTATQTLEASSSYTSRWLQSHVLIPPLDSTAIYSIHFCVTQITYRCALAGN